MRTCVYACVQKNCLLACFVSGRGGVMNCGRGNELWEKSVCCFYCANWLSFSLRCLLWAKERVCACFCAAN